MQSHSKNYIAKAIVFTSNTCIEIPINSSEIDLNKLLQFVDKMKIHKIIESDKKDNVKVYNKSLIKRSRRKYEQK